uniref:Uncharacterized protein n=1 Tax=Cyprinodon variegatus TaxID=28743 RepID=A0A3Q2DKI0_CYPVA
LASKKQDVDDVINLCSKLSAYEELKVAVETIAKATAIAASTFSVGAALFGPVGLVVGGVVGGVLAWKNSKSFRPLHQILMDLLPPQKLKLYREIKRKVLRSLTWKNAEHLLTIVKERVELRKMVISTLVIFLAVYGD